MAASTHPFALWWEQQPTDKDRYKVMAEDLGMVAQAGTSEMPKPTDESLDSVMIENPDLGGFKIRVA